jgi:glycerol uptake facilitator protein
VKQEPPLLARCLAEALGTFILVFLGCGAVHAAVLMDAQKGLWQVAVVWGIAVTIAVYVVGGVSGAHINPAITVMLACFRRFSPVAVGPYVISQVAGAFLAAGALFILFEPFIRDKETELYVKRGDPGSVMTARCYGEYYPNPGAVEKAFADNHPFPLGQGKLDAHFKKISQPAAFLAEFLGTMLLALTVLAVTDERNRAAPLARLGPAFIGLIIAALISVIDPLTMACFNPARDFGPRLLAYLAGWGEVAIPGPNGMGFWTVYIVAPIVGAFAGGALYTGMLRPFLPSPVEPLEEQESEGEE